jgi:hypothetical protein
MIITQYKLLAFSNWWTNQSFSEKVSAELSEHAKMGWHVRQIVHGWSAWLMPTLYIFLERELGPDDEGKG